MHYRGYRWATQERINLWIGEGGKMTARLLETMERIEAGEVIEGCEHDLGFQTWEHFATELGEEAPELAADLLTMPIADRYALFDTPAGQEILQRLLARWDFDTSCPG